MRGFINLWIIITALIGGIILLALLIEWLISVNSLLGYASLAVAGGLIATAILYPTYFRTK